MNAEEIAAKLASHEQRIIGVEHRVKDLEETQKQIQDLTISVKELALSVKNMVSEQMSQGERIDRLEDEPAEKWKLVYRTIITAIVSTLAGAVASGLILLLVRVN